MKNRWNIKNLLALTTLLGLLTMPTLTSAKEVIQQWELVNPAGVIKVMPIKMAPRINSLEGKTVGLKWDMKPNGNIFLDRVAELLRERVSGVKILKFYELEPSTAPQSENMQVADRKAQIIAKYKPDIVIGAQAD